MPMNLDYVFGKKVLEELEEKLSSLDGAEQEAFCDRLIAFAQSENCTSIKNEDKE